MSPKRKPSQEERRRRKEARECEKRVRKKELAQGTAAVYTCLYEVIRDFADQCGYCMENIEADIAFTEFAMELWKNRPGQAESFHQALTDLLVERKRHHAALTVLEKCFLPLFEPAVHDHLEPLEAYEELAERILF